MKSRTFTQLHASLYMQERFTDKKEKDSFNFSKDSEAKTKGTSRTAVTEHKNRKG